MEHSNVRELQDVVIRFSGDSGDGMQLTGTLFSDTSALLGNGTSTFPDYPAEIRAPQGTVAGVSGFQVHFGDHREINPGDYCDVLVAMNPAALKANRKWLKPGATVILDGDSITEDHLKKACFATLDPIAELQLDEYNVVIPDITSMTREALKETGLDNKAVTKCKNMFALGICFWLFDRPEEYALRYLDTKFAKKNPAVAEANKLAIKAGYNYAANTHQFANTYAVPAAPLEKGTYRSINGNVATAWGLMAAAEKVATGLITYAARDSEFDGRPIRKGEIMALENGKIVATGSDITKMTYRLARSMKKKDSQFITVISGAEVSEEDAEHTTELVQSKCGSSVEVSHIHGGQPVYYYMLSVE